MCVCFRSQPTGWISVIQKCKQTYGPKTSAMRSRLGVLPGRSEASLPPTATVKASVETRSPSAPTHHGILVHLSGHDVLVAQLPGQPELLIGLILCGRPHVGLVVRSVRLHVELLSFPCDQSELAWRQRIKQLLL